MLTSKTSTEEAHEHLQHHHRTAFKLHLFAKRTHMEQQHAMNRNEERSTKRENGIAIENVIRQVSLITRER